MHTEYTYGWEKTFKNSPLFEAKKKKPKQKHPQEKLLLL